MSVRTIHHGKEARSRCGRRNVLVRNDVPTTCPDCALIIRFFDEGESVSPVQEYRLRQLARLGAG